MLTDEKLTLGNLPRLADVDNFSHLLNGLGVSTKVAGVKKGEFGRRMTLEASEIASTVAPYDMVRKMRASILVLGPMLARAGESTVSLPGGCAIGDRPIDLHLKALEALGAEIELAAGYVKATAPKGRLTGGDYSFPVVSVGATENALMAAVLATGRSQLFNAAREPEIVDLCNLLVAMGGEDRRHRHRRTSSSTGSRGSTAAPMTSCPTGSRRAAMPARRGSPAARSSWSGRGPHDMLAITNALAAAGLVIEFTDDGIKVTADKPLKPLAISTAPYPGFPTDMQAQFMAMLCVRRGRKLPRGDDLREPLHARPRTAPHGRRDRRPRPLGDRPRASSG